MRRFIPFLAMAVLYGCTQAISQQPSEDAKRDAEFEKLLQQARQTREKTKIYLQEADKETVKLVEKTKEKIMVLEEEVTVLKETINEIKNTNDTADLNIGFKLLPVSGDQDHR
jgi:tRNA C32,U32 (ribose-2'-O)-methylase TrmJ